MTLPAVLGDFLAAIEKRDVSALEACFTEDATYATAVPLPALVGRDAIVKLFGQLLGGVSSASFEILGHSVDGDRVWTERIDHFVFDDKPVSIECMGIFELEGDRIKAVRDYVDMNTWRERKGS